MKKFSVFFAVVTLLLPVVSSTDDAIALQDGWFNADPLDDGISKAPHRLKHSDDDSLVVATMLRQLDSFQIVAVVMLPFVIPTGAAIVRYDLGGSQSSIVRIAGRSPPLS